jgi:hypothetical protein
MKYTLNYLTQIITQHSIGYKAHCLTLIPYTNFDYIRQNTSPSQIKASAKISSVYIYFHMSYSCQRHADTLEFCKSFRWAKKANVTILYHYYDMG